MPDQPRKKLTAKQTAFVELYLTHWNGARAAREAGYSEATARHIASQLLADPVVQSYRDERLAELQMGAVEVHKRLSDMARASMKDCMTIKEKSYTWWSPKARYERGTIVDRDGDVYKATADNGPTKVRKGEDVDPEDGEGFAVDPLSDRMGIYWQPTERERYADIDVPMALDNGYGPLIKRVGYDKFGRQEIELVDSKDAALQIGRIHKMFTDKVENSADEETLAAVESLDRKLQDLADRQEGGTP